VVVSSHNATAATEGQDSLAHRCTPSPQPAGCILVASRAADEASGGREIGRLEKRYEKRNCRWIRAWSITYSLTDGSEVGVSDPAPDEGSGNSHAAHTWSAQPRRPW
jgi:hypothetical protein